jgi:hypothetical protein
VLEKSSVPFLHVVRQSQVMCNVRTRSWRAFQLAKMRSSREAGRTRGALHWAIAALDANGTLLSTAKSDREATRCKSHNYFESDPTSVPKAAGD